MQYYAKELGLKIKDLRRKKNMTQAQLAELLSYATERQLKRIENQEAGILFCQPIWKPIIRAISQAHDT